MKYPCQDCERRMPGCHANCVDYLVASAEHELQRQEDYKKRDSLSVGYCAFLKRKIRIWKKNGKKRVDWKNVHSW